MTCCKGAPVRSVAFRSRSCRRSSSQSRRRCTSASLVTEPGVAPASLRARYWSSVTCSGRGSASTADSISASVLMDRNLARFRKPRQEGARSFRLSNCCVRRARKGPLAVERNGDIQRSAGGRLLPARDHYSARTKCPRTAQATCLCSVTPSVARPSGSLG
jgi:hypothetical protein